MITALNTSLARVAAEMASVPRATESPGFGDPPFGRFITAGRALKRADSAIPEPSNREAERTGRKLQQRTDRASGFVRFARRVTDVGVWVGKGDAVPARRKIYRWMSVCVR